MHKFTMFAAIAGITALAGCGDTFGERALYGGGAGALGAAALDVNPLAGAAAGAGANLLYCQENPDDC